MKKTFRFSTRNVTAFLIAFSIGCIFLFVLWTFPWSHNDAPSTIKVEWLPRSEWGFGSTCYYSGAMPATGRSYGPIQVIRQYDFRQYNTGHQQGMPAY
jgi:hypothetical protein